MLTFSRQELFIDWLINYSNELNAVGSLLLTIAIIGIYLKQHKELQKQTEAMSSQVNVLQAGFTPLLEVQRIAPRSEHPTQNETHPDYIEIEIANLGNEAAKDIEILFLVNCTPTPDSDEVEIGIHNEPLESTAVPHVVREGAGGVIGEDEMKVMFAAVELGLEGPDITEPPRFPIALSVLENEGVEEICLGLVIRYKTLTNETDILPIEPALQFTVDADYESFEEAYHECGRCDIESVFSEEMDLDREKVFN